VESSEKQKINVMQAFKFQESRFVSMGYVKSHRDRLNKRQTKTRHACIATQDGGQGRLTSCLLHERSLASDRRKLRWKRSPYTRISGLRARTNSITASVGLQLRRKSLGRPTRLYPTFPGSSYAKGRICIVGEWEQGVRDKRR
jgi:hypothetical protein